MESNIFINEAINKAIENYLTYKSNPNKDEYNSFLVIVIRMLILIYGELDIINPYRTSSEKGFDDNLKKFGLNDKLLLEFKNDFLNFYQNESEELFISIQKRLIDMFVLRKMHVLVTDEEINEFKSLLYTKEDLNPSKFALYNKLTPNSNEVTNYLNSKLFEINHDYKFIEYKEVALSNDAYQLAGFNAIEVLNMKEEDIINVNNKVYHFFRIRENDTNKRMRLNEAIEYYKKYGNTITSGNGFVDLLLLLGVITTGIMLLFIFGSTFLR